MYDKSQILRAIRNPREVALEAHNQFHRRILRRSGIKVMDQDWDNLIILDACRFDMFSETNTLPGKLEPVLSRGSRTSEFLRQNFKEEFLDTLYVTANPMHEQIGVGNPFHDIVPVWQDEWNEEYDTVLPGTLTNRVLETHEEYPQKRLIVHYNQPDIPFIGEYREIIESAKRDAAQQKTEVSFSRFEHVTQLNDGNIWQAIALGLLNTETVYNAFIENLELALEHVSRLLEVLDGRSVVTSDHGNAIADQGPFGLTVYGHPYRTFMTEIVKVPWLIVTSDTRRHVVEGSKREQVPVDEELVSDRLENLGYV